MAQTRSVMQNSELRLPADRAYLVVAKRTAAALATVAGFDLDAVDDLTIAVSQAFENAVGCLEESGYVTGEVRCHFKLNQRGLEVTVKSIVDREAELEARAALRARQQQVRQREAVGANDLALRLMGLFVDDHEFRRDARTGALRVRLTKYRVS